MKHSDIFAEVQKLCRIEGVVFTSLTAEERTDMTKRARDSINAREYAESLLSKFHECNDETMADLVDRLLILVEILPYTALLLDETMADLVDRLLILVENLPYTTWLLEYTEDVLWEREHAVE